MNTLLPTTHDQQRRSSRSARGQTDCRAYDADTQAALDHIDAWRARTPKHKGPYSSWLTRTQAWGRTRGNQYLHAIVVTGGLMMVVGLLWGHGLYDMGEALALGGGGVWAQLLLAIETGGVPI